MLDSLPLHVQIVLGAAIAMAQNMAEEATPKAVPRARARSAKVTVVLEEQPDLEVEEKKITIKPDEPLLPTWEPAVRRTTNAARNTNAAPREMEKKMKELTERGKVLATRRNSSFWKEVINMQKRTLRAISSKKSMLPCEVNFVQDCWHLASYHFGCKKVHSKDVQNLSLTYLSNCLKLYEQAVEKGHHAVTGSAVRFVQNVLKKYTSNPAVMDRRSILWIHVKEALRVLVNHPTDLDTILAILNAVLDVQRKYIGLWNRRCRKEEPYQEDKDFFSFVMDELSALTAAANTRLQQSNRMASYSLTF